MDEREELEQRKQDVLVLREELNKLNEEKEAFYREKTGANSKIHALLQEIDTLTAERNSFIQQVKQLKAERDALHAELKKDAEAIEKQDQQKREAFAKHRLKESPGELQRRIEKLEFAIETEGLSFDKEQKLTAKVKEIKKILEETKKVAGAFEQLRQLKNAFHGKKERAQELHMKIQALAMQGQERHEKIHALYRKVDALKERRDEPAARYLEKKGAYEKVKEELEGKLHLLNELSKKLGIEEKTTRTARLRDKTAMVQEKIKKGQKLTTEDLLVYQAVEGK